MVITSSPYYGLRSYLTVPQIWGGDETCEHDWITSTKKGISGGTKSKKVQIKGKDNFQITQDSKYGFCSKCNAWLGELGQEPDFKLFIEHLVLIFDEVKRILTPDGSCWANLGDSYSGSNQGNGSKNISAKQHSNRGTRYMHEAGAKSLLAKTSVPRKSLMGIPDRFKIAMIDNGWICRNEIIWHRPNQMPSSVRDRFTVDFEKFYFFTKSEDYYFEQQFEPYTSTMNRWGGTKLKADGESAWDEGTGQSTYRTRNMRPNEKGKNKRAVWSINTVPQKVNHFASFPQKLVETPILACCPEKGIVLDMFFGSGTSGVVAKKNNRKYIGIDLNPEYVEIAEKRLAETNAN